MKVIDILNSTIGPEMEAFQIRDKTTIIVEATKVVTKKACSYCARKYLQLGKDVNSFKKIFDDCLDQGLPSPWDRNGDLYPFQNYHILLVEQQNNDKDF